MMCKFRFTLIVILLFTSCSQPHFRNVEEVRHQLEANQELYEKVALEWSQQNKPGVMFVRFSTGRYRWHEHFIQERSDGFEVGKGKFEGPRLASLAEVARHVGTSEHDLAYWMTTAESLHIYALSVAENGYVEFLLRGSEWRPYGLRYALTEQSQRFLLAAAARGKAEGTDRTMRHIGEKWFYFEAKHL